jgi:hypothetical protein
MPDQKKNSAKLYESNKIYIFKEKARKTTNNETNLNVQSIKLNDTSPSVLGRSSYRPLVKKSSIDHPTIMPRLSSRGRHTVNPLSSTTGNDSKIQFPQPVKNFIYRSSIHDEKDDDK